MNKNIYDNYENIISKPQKNDYKSVIYDNLSNINNYGLNGKYGSQIVILTFMNERGEIEGNINENVFTMILREPFKLSLSMKQPADSPYVSMLKEFQKTNKQRCAISGIDEVSDGQYNLDRQKMTKLKRLYDPINITDDYSIKMYSGTEHPTFTLNGRIYMDKTIFRPIQDEKNIKTNYDYTKKLISKILQCILPKKLNNDEALQSLMQKFDSSVVTATLDKVGLLKYFVAVNQGYHIIENGGIKEYSKYIDSIDEGTYGTNLVSFSIPWLFGNIATFGSKNNLNSANKLDKDGNPIKTENNENVKINYGNVLKTKCFIKHFDYKISKEYYVEKTITNGEHIDERFPAYIDINLTLESVQIPSYNTWTTCWLKDYTKNK